jgi:DNA-binding HxlR family transcriptional regulator
MPKGPWSGYGRFCPLARGLDLLGDRWTLIIVQELLKRPLRYGALADRLPGIGTSVLSERLKRLERAGIVVREPGQVGQGVVYALSERGRALDEPLRALRRWGAEFLFDPTADGSPEQHYDVTYVDGIDELEAGRFELVVDGHASEFSFSKGELHQRPGSAVDPELTVWTSSAFLDRWAAGDAGWDDGLATGEVMIEGREGSWLRWQAATGYLQSYEPEGTDE